MLQIVIGPDVDDMIERPDFGVEEGAERRHLDAFCQRLDPPLLDFRHRSRLQSVGPHLEDHRPAPFKIHRPDSIGAVNRVKPALCSLAFAPPRERTDAKEPRREQREGSRLGHCRSGEKPDREVVAVHVEPDQLIEIVYAVNRGRADPERVVNVFKSVGVEVEQETVHDAHRVDIGADCQAIIVEAEQHRRGRSGRIDRREDPAEIDKAMSDPARINIETHDLQRTVVIDRRCSRALPMAVPAFGSLMGAEKVMPAIV